MSTLKMNWGAKIAVLYIGFVALIITLVVGSMRQDFDLVSKDYYAQELAYEKTIDASRNTAALSAPLSLRQDEQVITIQFPAVFSGKVVDATLHFYSSIDDALDRTVKLNSSENKIVIQRSLLPAAAYTLKMSWSSEGKEYYQEFNVNLTK